MLNLMSKVPPLPVEYTPEHLFQHHLISVDRNPCYLVDRSLKLVAIPVPGPEGVPTHGKDFKGASTLSLLVVTPGAMGQDTSHAEFLASWWAWVRKREGVDVGYYGDCPLIIQRPGVPVPDVIPCVDVNGQRIDYHPGTGRWLAIEEGAK